LVTATLAVLSNIDDPANFNNQGKYPLILANSCLTGDIFSTSKTSASEGWVIIANRGAIGYLAMVYEGNASYLNLFSDRLFIDIGPTKTTVLPWVKL
jgi:hypothetical protein